MVKVWKVVVCVSAVATLAAGLASAGGPIDLTRVGQPTVPMARVQGIPRHSTAQIVTPTFVLDNFNRPDGSLGSNWIVQSGSFGIVSNTARGSSNGLVTFVGGSGAALEADVAANGATDTDYVALVLGYADTANNLFLKVQTQNGAGTFDTAGCYVGNNGSGGGFGLAFFTLSAPFATAHMRVDLSGTTATMTFTNIDGGAGTQSYTCTGAPATGGTGIGMGGYAGVASLDNFAGAGAAPAAAAIPAVGSLGLLLLALALVGTGIAWLLRRY